MRVVFLGTPEFAVPSLLELLSSPYEVCAVFTQPDRPAGRGQKPQPPPVKAAAALAGIPVHQPERIRNDEHRALFESLQPDFIVVVAYGQILPEWLLKSARLAPINVHASLLPLYRGAAPVIWAILQGESVTGVTTMLMDEHLDTGNVLLKREVPIPDDISGGDLGKILAQVGAEMLLPTLEGMANGTIHPEPQDSTRASWAPRLTKAQAWISWLKTSLEIHNQIRALNPWPLACTNFQGQRLQILRSRVSSMHSQAQPGTFLDRTDEGFRVGCADGTCVEILKVKPANRHSMSGREFMVGARLENGSLPFADQAG